MKTSVSTSSASPAETPARKSWLRRHLESAWRWLQGHTPPRLYVIVVAVIIGLLTGFGAFMLKWLIGHVTDFLTSHLDKDGPNYLLLGLPVAGLLLTTLFMRFVIREDISHGIDKVKKLVVGGDYDLRPSLTYTPVLASSLTLGFGGSAGAEGPIATVGAAIGSNMGRIMGLSGQELMVMIGCGAGAGIAGIFKAPVGGMLFTLEVLRLPMTTVNVISLMIASIVSALTCYVFTGFTFDVEFVQAVEVGPELYGYVALLGVFCGLYSLFYSRIMDLMGGWFGSMKSKWLRSIAGGLILGVLVFTFPALYGEGYGVATKMVNSDYAAILTDSLWFKDFPSPLLLLLVTAGVAVVKAFATSSTTWGGVAGDFAPALYAGCMTGYVFAAGFNMLTGFTLPVADFALIGMAAVMSGAIRAPLMAIFLTAEMTGNFHLFMPIVIAATISYCIVAAWGKIMH